MEVHAHTHTPRKKWTHYFWEFLMLFIAVTLGFFVENQREHYIESKREKVFIRGFLDDLANDTLVFSTFIANTWENELRIDSLMKLMKEVKPGDPTEEIYYFARIIFAKIDRLQYNSRTYSQLKSSGGLRLIHKKQVLDSISNYFESLQWIDLQNQIQIDRQSLYAVQLGEVFNAWTLDSIFNSGFQRPLNSPPLLTTDKKELNRFVNRLHVIKGVVNFNMKKTINDYLPKAKKLIKIIKEAYHLK